MTTTICTRCRQPIAIGDHPFCPHGKGSYVKHAPVTYPGGLTLYNLGSPEPTTVYSETERQAIMRERGLREAVYHIPAPDSDKSPVTRSWNTPCAYTLEQARILVSRQAQPRDADAGHLDTLAMDWVRVPRVTVKA